MGDEGMRKFSIWQGPGSISRGRFVGGLLGLLVLALVAAGCAAAATGPAVQPTAAPAQAATAPVQPAVAPTSAPAAATVVPEVLPATGATSAPQASGNAAGGPALVNLSQKANFGLFLVDGKGMTLYEYTKDAGNTSNCYGQCAVNWPPLLTTGAPQGGPGVTPSLLGTTTRTDGKTQVTFSGHPLYYFIKDQKPGDVTGQGVGGVWYVLSPRGEGMTNSTVPGPGTPQASSVFKPQATPAGPAALGLSQTNELGQFLVDAKGMTLYLYTKDTPNTSNCYDTCAVMWPPLLTSGAPTAGSGLNAALLGTTTRKDGTTQVTYNGWPLYYWFRDQQASDTKGQWVGGVWFVVSPKGDIITAGKPAAAPGAASTNGGAGGAAAPAATSAPSPVPSGGSYGGSGY
jgi:predicted lipoprotein with Yx(FWY)xxD motif